MYWRCDIEYYNRAQCHTQQSLAFLYDLFQIWRTSQRVLPLNPYSYGRNMFVYEQEIAMKPLDLYNGNTIANEMPCVSF